jgi:hypothetical protein
MLLARAGAGLALAALGFVVLFLVADVFAMVHAADAGLLHLWRWIEQ